MNEGKAAGRPVGIPPGDAVLVQDPGVVPQVRQPRDALAVAHGEHGDGMARHGSLAEEVADGLHSLFRALLGQEPHLRMESLAQAHASEI